MTNKSNVEIIVEKLKKIHGEYMVAKALATRNGEYYKDEDEWKDKFFKPLATTLLSKLNKLDIKTITLIAKELWIEGFKQGRSKRNMPYVNSYVKKNETFVKSKIDQILQLVPEEGEVIAEGKVTYDGSAWKIGDKYINTLDIICNPGLYINWTKVKLIIKEE